jgi:hypothetical protein
MNDGQLLDALAEWFDSYLHETEHQVSRWWKCTQTREFWDDIPGIVEGLLRRR